MIYLWDKNKKYIAVLENAFNVSYEKTINQLWRASFTLPVNAVNQERLNIIPYLKSTDTKVSRGKHTIEIYPNGLARIEANLILRVFIQSQLGGKY